MFKFYEKYHSSKRECFHPILPTLSVENLYLSKI